MLQRLVLSGLTLLATTAVEARWDDPEAGLPRLEVHRLGDFTAGWLWESVEDARGRLYVGSDNILEFDGLRWTLIPVGRGDSVMSLTVDDTNRIWCGGAGELGYLDEDATGKRSFHSLRPWLPAGLDAVSVYRVHRLAGRTLFVLPDSVLIWTDGRFEHRSMPADSTLRSFNLGGSVYISQPGVGLSRWDGTEFETVPWAGPELGPIRSAWLDGQDRPVFLAAGSLIRLESGLPVRFAEDTLREIAPSNLVSAARLPNEKVALVSQTAGVFILDDDGQVLRHLDRQEGLPGQTTWSITLGRNGRTWISEYVSVVAVDSANVQTLFTGANGNGGDAVAFIHSDETGTLSATTESIGRLEPVAQHAARFRPLPHLRGVYRDLHRLPDGRVIAAGRHQIVHVRAEEAVPLYKQPVLFFEAGRLDRRRSRIAIGAGPDVAVLDLDQADPLVHLLAGFPAAVTRLTGDGSGTAWGSMRRDGVMEIARIAEPDSVRRHFRPGHELPLPFNDPAVFILDGHAYAYASTAIVKLPQTPNESARVVSPGIGLLTAERTAEHTLWGVVAAAGKVPHLARIVRQADGSLDVRPTNQRIRDVGNITVFARTEEHIVWIGGSEGAIRIDTREIAEEPVPVAPIVQAVTWRTGETAARLPLAAAPTVAFHRAGTVEFQLRDDRDPFARTQFIETRLASAGEAWRPTGTTRTLETLDEGTHRLEARTVSFLGTPGPIISYTFTITPPWFRTPLAYLAYVLVFGGSVYGAAQWRTRRIRRQNVQLEQLVTRRTEELAQAVAARSAFLANMGHEIRNPLNGVVGLVASLRTEDLNPRQKGLANHIGTCADQLISVIDDVLEYARIDAGRVAVRNRAFIVREPVEAAIDIFRAARPEATIGLEADPAALEARIIGDPDRIRHILVNYLANALKFGGGTPVQVAVRREHPLLVFTVTDHGPGISAEEQARLFVRFSRGSLAYQNAIPGTGLGLAACKTYAEAMGGDVSVDSTPGQGATFHLRIPATAAPADLPPAPVPRTDSVQGRHVLVVDDQDFNRMVITDLLGRMGATSAQAASIEEAREAFRARVPDIVFVDFDLAGANGADLADWIRKQAPAGRDVPIIAATAFEVDEVRRRCEEAGMDGFIAKPITASRLAEVVTRIDRIRSGEPPPASHDASAGTTPSSFLDVLAGGDPGRRAELLRSTWREVLAEALAAHRALRRDDAPLTARHAHRLVSAALILSQRELVATARELNALAKAADFAGARLCAQRLRERIRSARRQHTG